MLSFAEVSRSASAGDPEAQEQLAAAYEQAGRPAEAAQWLRRAADAGLTSARARLGLWRLVGFGQPPEPAAGVADIIGSAKAGDPLGLSLAAVVTAGGVGCRRDPQAALGWLAAAAASGDGRALCQLGVLLRGDGTSPAEAAALLAEAAARGFEPARDLGAGTPIEALDYAALAQAIDLSAFDAPLEVAVRREAPYIAEVRDLLPGWACDYVMALAGPVLTRGKVLDETGGESVRTGRSNSVMNFGLMDSDVVLELINERLARAAGMPPPNAEGLGVLHYAVGEQYAPHVDFIPDTPANAAQIAERGQRVRTLLVYLNDDFDAGATEFIRLGLAFKPARGCGLVFDSVTASGEGDPMTLHRGAPPTRGQKWVISKWFRTKPLRPGAAS